MTTLTPIEWKVLELTAAEPENLGQIYERLRETPEPVPLDEAADAVRSLVVKGLLTPSPSEGASQHPMLLPSDPSFYWKTPFKLSLPSMNDVEAWISRPEPPRRRSLYGIFKGRIPDVPFEVFKENRRDMSKKYTEDASDE